MKAFWRGKGKEEIRWSLYALQGGKYQEIPGLRGYSSWDNPKAEKASEPIAAAIEAEARAMGYEIIENPID